MSKAGIYGLNQGLSELKNIQKANQLFRFMTAFGIDRWKLISTSEKSVCAVVGWPDEGQPFYDPEEETQEIRWKIQNLDLINESLGLLERLYSSGHFDSDKITISREQLFIFTQWDKNKLDKVIETLLSIKVDMIDDGEKTDSFFVNF